MKYIMIPVLLLFAVELIGNIGSFVVKQRRHGTRTDILFLEQHFTIQNRLHILRIVCDSVLNASLCNIRCNCV